MSFPRWAIGTLQEIVRLLRQAYGWPGVPVLLALILEKTSYRKKMRETVRRVPKIGLVMADWLERKEWWMTAVLRTAAGVAFVGLFIFANYTFSNRYVEEQLRNKLAAAPCPPNSPTFITSEIIQMYPGSRQSIWGLTESIFRPPGSTSPFAAQIAIAGEAILWSDDGGQPNHLAMPGAKLWECGERVSKFRAALKGAKAAALVVGYAR